MSRSFHLIPLCLACAVATSIADRAAADFVAITTPTNTTMQFTSDATIGYEFLTGASPLYVSALGVWDEQTGTSSLAVSHEIAIWIASGTLLAETTVPAGAPTLQIGAYSYVTLSTTLQLAANSDYVIGVATNNEDFHNSLVGAGNGPVFNTPYLSEVERRSDFTGGLVFPAGTSAGTTAWDAPNFLFSVPEPTTYLLLALGTLFIICVGYGRRLRFPGA